jgi:class 3 adenylate cyclase/tetratricopeptide (TPR) repeat protein
MASSTLAPPDGKDRRGHFTLLFCDLCDYTTLSELSDPEDTHGLRRSIEHLARSVIPKHGGAINQFVGDGILAVFGFPEPDEEGVRRAVEAALELHALAPTIAWSSPPPPGFNLLLHSGIHAGLVFVNEGGDPLHGRYELTGDAVNTAARLCSAAGRNEILVSATSLRGAESFFETEAIAPLHLKGKQKPVPAYRILGRSSVATRFEARSRLGLTPFVGRGAELVRLDAALAQAAAARGNALCIEGDAGIGKTRLLEEFQRKVRASTIRIFKGSCENYGGVAPLQPFLQIARELLSVPNDGDLRRASLAVERGLSALDEALLVHLPAFLHLLALAPWPRGETDRLQLAAVTALLDLVLAVGRQQTVVLVIDDWQWVDDASKQVLGRLVRSIHDQRVLIVLGTRSIGRDDPVLGSLPRVELTPFTEVESLRAVHALVNAPLKDWIALGMHRRSGGNPLFLEELCRSLLPEDESAEELEEVAIPSTVHSLIHTRVARLEPAQAELLRAASIVGNESSSEILQALVRVDAFDDVVGDLIAAGLLRAGDTPGSVRFQHGITREVVYESVRVRDRRRLHAEVARFLEQRYERASLADHYEALASHYARAGEYQRAFEYAELAGDKAASRSALDRARVQYAAALSHVEKLSTTPELGRRWLSIAAKWSGACVFNPARGQLSVLYAAAERARELSAYDALGHALYWLGWIYYALGEQASSIEQSERALKLAEQAHDERLTAQLHSNLGQSHAAAGSYDLALVHLERSIEMKRQRSLDARGRHGVPVGFAFALGCKALVHGDRGQFHAANIHVQEALDVVRDTGNAIEGSLLCLLGMIQIWQGRWQEALLTAARGRATGERVNGPYVLALCRTVAGYATWVLDRSPLALEELESALTWFERREIGLYLSFAYCHLAHAMFQAGRYEAAEGYAQKALERANQTDPVGEAMAHRTLALLRHAGGDFEQARAHCEAALRSAARRGSEREVALTLLTQAELELAGGERSSARERLDAALARFDEMSMSWHRAECERLRRLC